MYLTKVYHNYVYYVSEMKNIRGFGGACLEFQYNNSLILLLCDCYMQNIY